MSRPTSLFTGTFGLALREFGSAVGGLRRFRILTSSVDRIASWPLCLVNHIIPVRIGRDLSSFFGIAANYVKCA